MSKRSRVPAALHSELEEYASLVRALRTSKTLDLASHLTQYSQTQTQRSLGPSEATSSHEDSEEEGLDASTRKSSAPSSSVGDAEEDEIDELDTDSEPADGEGKGKTKSASGIKRRRKSRATSFNERDIWTRWPLLAGDVHIPTWGLDDEVAALSSSILHAQQNPSSPSPSDAEQLPNFSDVQVYENEEEEVEAENERAHLPYLAASSAHTLSHLLSALAQYVPRVEKSLRNRLAPLDWSAVLQAAKAGELGLEPSSIARLERRLESLYGSVDVIQDAIMNEPAARTERQHPIDRIKELKTLFDDEEGGLLTFFGPRPPQPQPKSKRRKTHDAKHKPETEAL